MKKKLEADLISIAHRVLQMKNKSDIDQLYVETQKLYEKLSVLRFVEANFEDAKPTIGQAEIIEKLDQIDLEIPTIKVEPVKVLEEVIEKDAEIEEIVAQEIIKEVDVIEPVKEDVVEIKLEATESVEVELPIKEVVLPIFELEKETIVMPKKANTVEISFEDLLGENYDEPLFVKVDPNKEKANPLDFELPKLNNISNERAELLDEIQVSPKDIETKVASLNDKLAKGISIGLNDRIAFVKHLFGNSNEDYNRVLNQLITFDSFEEAQRFIEDMVKPDYNNWEGKEDYSKRFVAIIEKKFA